MELTKDQKEGLKWLIDWVQSDKPTATLSGFAGTGKSTLIKEFLNKYRFRVAVTAPTHKAVNVISKILNRTGRTLHSLHGLRPNVNLATFDINNVQFDPLGAITIGEYSLIVIDEASMINAGLYKLNEDRAKTFNTKILYVGDELQLPPVNERVSQVFLSDNIFRLTTVMRQEKDNPISTLLELVRQDIKNNSTYLCINHILKNPVGIKTLDDGMKHGYALLGREQFNEKLLDEFPEVFNGTDLRYIAYTNENVMEVNSYIRNNLIASNDIITKGDILTSNTNTYDEFQSIMISNSSDYKVLDVTKTISDYGFEMFVCDLIDITSGQLINAIKIVNHRNSEAWRTYNEVLGVIYNTAINSAPRDRGANWKAYYAFKKEYLQMIRSTFAGNKTVERDLSYGYATTTHKSQGSTYDISFINVKSIVLDKNGNFIRNWRTQPHRIEYVNKLLYVALSRARIKSILLWI